MPEKILHTVSWFLEAEKESRYKFACSTWNFLQSDDFHTLKIYNRDLKRTTKDIGDERELPFIHDLLDTAFRKRSYDAVFLANSDICLATDTADRLNKVLKETEAAYFRRYEFETDLTNLPDSVEVGEMLRHTVLGGSDAFLMTRNAWKKIKKVYPDMVIGCQWWDSVLQDIMDKMYSRALADQTNQKIIYHRLHAPFWARADVVLDNAGQKHNRELTTKYGLIAKERKEPDLYGKNVQVDGRVKKVTSYQIAM